MSWLLLAAAAHAGITEADLARIVREERPAVEHALGRSMGAAPEVEIDDLEHLVARIVARGGPPGVTDEERATEVRRTLADALAYWDGADGRLYFVSDAIRRTLDSAEAGPADVEPLMRCLAMHELTHAVQGRAAHRTAPPLPRDVERALTEGQATVVEQDGCPPTLSLFAGLALPQDLSADDGSEAAFAYVHGSIFTRALRDRHGADGVWALLEHGTVTRAEIEDVVDRVIPAAWRDPKPLAAWAMRLHAGAADRSEAQRMPATAMLPLLAPGVVRGQAALRAAIEGPTGRSGMMAFAVTDPAAAARWVAARAEAWRGPAESLAAPISVGSVTRRAVSTPASLTRTPGVTAATVLHADRAEGCYEEVWVLVGSALVGGWRTAPTDGREVVTRAVLGAATAYAATPVGQLDAEAAAILDRAAGKAGPATP